MIDITLTKPLNNAIIYLSCTDLYRVLTFVASHHAVVLVWGYAIVSWKHTFMTDLIKKMLVCQHFCLLWWIVHIKAIPKLPLLKKCTWEATVIYIVPWINLYSHHAWKFENQLTADARCSPALQCSVWKLFNCHSNADSMYKTKCL